MPGGPVNAPEHQAGLFGKMPAHGDFVRRGPAAVVARLDDWLTGQLAEIAASHDDLDGWLAGMPCWCFVQPDGDGYVAGALLASEDKVGRRFPLIAFVTVAGSTEAIAAAEGVRAVAADVDNVVTADLLVERLGVVEPVQPADPASDAVVDETWWRDDFDPATAITLEGAPVGPAFLRLLEPAER